MTGSWEFEKTSFNDNYVIATSSWYYKHCGNGSCGRIVIEQPMVVVTVVTALLL